jgi:exopolysaccharide biosynthesis WecB/TagA/CpsF family protein
MKYQQKIDVLNKVHSVDEPQHLITTVLGSEGTTTLGFVNQHGFNLCSKQQIHDNFMALDILLRDGIGMKMAMSLFGLKPGYNMNGTDLIPELVRHAKEQSVNVMAFGTEEPWLRKGIANLGVAEQCSAKHHGFDEMDRYISLFEQHHQEGQINLVILAMGMPKQEALASALKTLNKSRTVVVCGGAILDFQANKVKRAPALFRRTGLEWVYRLISEPQRMFKRYVIGIPVFFSHLLSLKAQAAFNR